ncbi:MAG TPA: glycine cleavage T C-terminal barrel domain-containing protein [Candidatus Acidoferrum sp.]|nr:glycine cleavage T C-terminal barrel domain-containing protein [Candidatus Acidoferrum sp.]
METPATIKTPATTKTMVTPRIHDAALAELQANAGANIGVWFGCALPNDFGDPAAEYRFANQSVALLDKNYRAYLSFTGQDRVRYLNAILTNNIKDLAAGQGTISLLLNPQGHILAELETYALADQHFCVSYAMIREQLIGWMDKFIIMDDVTLTDETERWGTLALEGPKAATAVKQVTGVALESLSELASLDAAILQPQKARPQDDNMGEARLVSEAPPSVIPSAARNPGTISAQPSPMSAPPFSAPSCVTDPLPCRIVKRSPGGVPGAEFVVERANLAPLWQILLEAVRKHGGGPLGYTALSGQRLAQGVAWFGYDFGEKQIPHEAGLENSHISYTKGCYTGQEIVERVRSRGHVNRRRVTLLFSGDAVPEAGAPLTTPDGKEAGYVTRAARIWDPERIIGMGYVGTAYIRAEADAPGTILHWPGGSASILGKSKS